MKVIMRQDLGSDGTDILIFYKEGGRRYIAKPVKLEFEPVTEGAPFKGPTLSLDSGTMQAFAEALDKEGIKTDKDAKIEGTLEATRAHLEDLQRLLNLKNRNRDK